MVTVNPIIDKLIAAKECRRRKLAALPFAEKVRLVVKLQQLAAPVLRARGLSVHVWSLEAGNPGIMENSATDGFAASGRLQSRGGPK